MKKMIFAGLLLSLAARVAHGTVEFKSYSFANYGSPFSYVPNTSADLTSAIVGGQVKSGGFPSGTLNQLLQAGPTSQSQEYDVGGGLHVAFSAAAVSRPAEPLSGLAPGIGAKVSASNNQNPGAATVIGENYVYLKDTVLVDSSDTIFHKLVKTYAVTISLDGVVHVGGDAVAQVGESINVKLDNGDSYFSSKMQTFQPLDSSGFETSYYFGQPFPFGGDPITLTNPGVNGARIAEFDVHTLTIETLLYVRAQSGISRGTGSVDAEFSNTMRVSNIQFFDENGDVIPGLRAIGADGDVYPYNAVPEPATMALFGAGSIGLLFARRTARLISA